mmetsp:Transcript_5881/g.7660  ORF Transcript_5881/g.7660 Transcript_5881/m.7660 type:complete len:142 (-) Transcript_5881:52-477(-)
MLLSKFFYSSCRRCATATNTTALRSRTHGAAAQKGVLFSTRVMDNSTSTPAAAAAGARPGNNKLTFDSSSSSLTLNESFNRSFSEQPVYHHKHLQNDHPTAARPALHEFSVESMSFFGDHYHHPSFENTNTDEWVLYEEKV